MKKRKEKKREKKASKKASKKARKTEIEHGKRLRIANNKIQ